MAAGLDLRGESEKELVLISRLKAIIGNPIGALKIENLGDNTYRLDGTIDDATGWCSWR